MIRNSGPPGTDAILFGVDRVRFLDSGAVMRMAQNRPLFAALLTGSLALHMFALLLLNWLEQAPTATKTSLEIPVELVSDPGASGKGSRQHAAAAGQKIAESKSKPASTPLSPSAPSKSQAAAQPKPTAQTKEPSAPKPEPPKPAQTQPLKLPQQPEQPKAAAAPTQPKSQANQPKPAAQPQQPAQPANAAQPKPPAAATQPPAAPPASMQLRGVPTMATLQMQAMHPSAAQLPFSMEENYQAVAVPSATANGDLETSYKTLVFSMLELAKQFPADARARGAQGTATVYFEIDDNGGVKSVKLVQSSGDTELDVESLAVVERAAPFPKPPRGAQRAFAAEIEFDPGEPAH